MSARIPLRFIPGDRTVVFGRLAEVIEIFTRGHAFAGRVRVVFVRAPWLSAIVSVDELECVGFTTFARAS